jgi:cytoskeletal protein CcmA (bactofilin family)
MSNPYDTATERMSILPPTLKFKGELYADEDLLIQGVIEGTINHTQRVTVGKEGKVKANIKAQIIKVEGSIEGDLHAEKSVYVDDTGNLRGNIHAPSVSIVEGANFNGAVDMDMKRGAQGTARPDAKANRQAQPAAAPPKTGTSGA